MLAAIILASQWHFLANKYAVLAGCSAFWPVNCIFLHKKPRTRKSGADLGFFVPQSKCFGGRGVIGAGRGRLQAGGGGDCALNHFYADSLPLDF